MQLTPIQEAIRAQRALSALSDLLIGTDDMSCVNRDNLSTLLGLIGDHLDQSLIEMEQMPNKQSLRAV